MRKIILLILLVILAIAIGYSFALDKFDRDQKKSLVQEEPVKKPILRFAVVSDSEGENDLLEKALRQAAGEGINFVIGLGDWTRVGTIEDLASAKEVFDKSKLSYFVTAGDHDLWESRERGEDPLANFNQVFGEATRVIEKNGIQIVLLDNSDIYRGIAPESWKILSESVNQWVSETSEPVNQKTGESESELPNHWITDSPTHRFADTPKLTFVMAHKTPFHPESKHVMGEDNAEVARQAERLMSLLSTNKVDGFFSGDLHFFAEFKDPKEAVKITTVGAVASERNFQGPRFGIVTVYDDYSWEVEDVEIR